MTNRDKPVTNGDFTEDTDMQTQLVYVLCACVLYILLFVIEQFGIFVYLVYFVYYVHVIV